MAKKAHTEILVGHYTHGTVSEGGSKSHLILSNSDRPLCGLAIENRLFQTTVKIDADWLAQPDPGGEACKLCKKAAKKLLLNI